MQFAYAQHAMVEKKNLLTYLRAMGEKQPSCALCASAGTKIRPPDLLQYAWFTRRSTQVRRRVFYSIEMLGKCAGGFFIPLKCYAMHRRVLYSTEMLRNAQEDKCEFS
jgi:hypothetical protein